MSGVGGRAEAYHVPQGFLVKTPAKFPFQLSPQRGDNSPPRTPLAFPSGHPAVCACQCAVKQDQRGAHLPRHILARLGNELPEVAQQSPGSYRGHFKTEYQTYCLHESIPLRSPRRGPC